jgi:hypothetical protein
VPVLQDSSVLQHLNAVYAGYGGGIDDAVGRLAVVRVRHPGTGGLPRLHIGLSPPSASDHCSTVPQTSPAGRRNRQKRQRSSVGGSQQQTQEQEDDVDDDPTLQMRGNESNRRTADVQFDGKGLQAWHSLVCLSVQPHKDGVHVHLTRC